MTASWLFTCNPFPLFFWNPPTLTLLSWPPCTAHFSFSDSWQSQCTGLKFVSSSLVSGVTTFNLLKWWRIFTLFSLTYYSMASVRCYPISNLKVQLAAWSHWFPRVCLLNFAFLLWNITPIHVQNACLSYCHLSCSMLINWLYVGRGLGLRSAKPELTVYPLTLT